MLLPRRSAEAEVRRLLRRFPVVAIVGARQVGKTTLARGLAGARTAGAYFDLEDPADLARLDDPMVALRRLKGLVVIDEIQRRPDLFPVLRVLADRRPLPARFLVLGSAAPELLRQSSESLAGRIAYHELGGFSLGETGTKKLRRLWLRGGMPPAFLAKTDADGADWCRRFIRTFTERDAPSLGINIPAATLHRFWAMLSHYHAQTFNAAELGRSFAMSDATVRRYLDALTSALVVRQLRPWFENIGKRQVKAPKIYLFDSGILHAMFGVSNAEELERHPKVGASWEGFALREVASALGARTDECFYWRTHTGAELDLLVVRGERRLGFEFKLTDSPRVTPSMRSALGDLRLQHLYVVHAGERNFPLTDGVTAVALACLQQAGIGPRKLVA